LSARFEFQITICGHEKVNKNSSTGSALVREKNQTPLPPHHDLSFPSRINTEVSNVSIFSVFKETVVTRQKSS
jgi:hypothetical protein